jgi:alditol oxidase
MTTQQKNWAGNLTYSAAQLHYPKTVKEVQDLVRRSSKVRVLGSRHSFNGIADTPEDLISLQQLDMEIVVHPEHHTVTVAGGVRYGELCQVLHRSGFAIHNLASLPHISIAGACATATHGSGDKNGNLATAVAAMEIVTADGELITLSREKDGENFQGAVVGLGGIGVVLSLTLDIIPAFDMRQDLYENLPLAAVQNHFDEVASSAYSVSLFTDWQADTFNQVWLKRRITADAFLPSEPEFFGAAPAIRKLHPIAEISAENCTDQMGIPGLWYERLPHFRMDFTPSSGEELQSEYFVPREHIFPALLAVHRLHKRVAPLLLISEIRTIAGDDLWMSPCYQQACVAIHFTWKPDWDEVRKLLPLIEEQLAPFSARPHWGKLFTMSPEKLQSLYERLQDFRGLLQHCDPKGKFRNAFLDTYVFGL